MLAAPIKIRYREGAKVEILSWRKERCPTCEKQQLPFQAFWRHRGPPGPLQSWNYQCLPFPTVSLQPWKCLCNLSQTCALPCPPSLYPHHHVSPELVRLWALARPSGGFSPFHLLPLQAILLNFVNLFFLRKFSKSLSVTQKNVSGLP